MVNLDFKYKKNSLDISTRDFMLNKVENYCFEFGMSCIDKNFRSYWLEFKEEKRILEEIERSFKKHLLFNTCCRDIYNQYLCENEDYLVKIGGSNGTLSKIKKIMDNDYISLNNNNKVQNSNLINKSKKNFSMFLFDLGDYTEVPKHFDSFISYFMIGLYSTGAIENKIYSPVELYKNSLLGSEYNEYGVDKAKTDLLISYLEAYYKNSSKFSLFDNFIFESEFNHLLTIEIMKAIEEIDKKIGREICEKEQRQIEFTLSFLSLLPVFNKRPFIEFFIILADKKFCGFNKKWTNKCINILISLSMVAVPIMEETYYYLLNNKYNSYIIKGKSDADTETYVSITSENWYIDVLQDSYKDDLNYFRNISSKVKDDKKDDYFKIQSSICILKNLLDTDIINEIYERERINADIEKEELTYMAGEEVNLVDCEKIIKNIKNILNGGVDDYIRNKKTEDNKVKERLEYKIKASRRMSELINEYVIEW